MSFVDLLRCARRGPTTVLHEFKTNYDPSKKRIHAFVEGYEDLVFYRFYLQSLARREYRVFTYRCGNKQAVYNTFQKLTASSPAPAHVLFFVDKDLSDVLEEQWPVDDRVYVTDVYSIENYFVTREVFSRLCTDLIRLRNVDFDFDLVFEHFEQQLTRFYRLVLPTMAWIVCARRFGLRPNLNNIDLDKLFGLSEDCSIGSAGGRAAYLATVTGVQVPEGMWRAVRSTIRMLGDRAAKEVVRGKFEVWFMIAFFQALLSKLGVIAGEVGGGISLKVNINGRNAIEMLVGRIPAPQSLHNFVARHYPQQLPLL